jgi:hypothetical protein
MLCISGNVISSSSSGMDNKFDAREKGHGGEKLLCGRESFMKERNFDVPEKVLCRRERFMLM